MHTGRIYTYGNGSLGNLTAFLMCHSYKYIFFCFTISAGAKPKISKELKHIEVEEGEVIKLKLEFMSDLPTTVTWYKDVEVIGKDLPCKVMSTESQTVLMVRKATWDHEGLYAVSVKVANACRKCGEEY